jgi:RNA polymerase sigma-70 factor (ECF subfamily)
MGNSDTMHLVLSASFFTRVLPGPNGSSVTSARAGHASVQTNGTQAESAGVRACQQDKQWLERVRQGDEDAARSLVQRLYPTVIKSVRHHLPRRTNEEDLAQAVFLKIFKNLDQYSGLVPLEHWVSRIAVNTCINQLKHEQVRPEWRMSDLSEEQETVVQQLAATHDPLPDEQSAMARELVEAMMVRLKPAERLIIQLLHLEERSVKEVSQITGWSASLVKVRAFRARNRMRGLWRKMFQEKNQR